jgi:uncharacterized protein YdeI (YjbR/CyaY-like superfamily)
MNSSVDKFIKDSKKWQAEIIKLRSFLLKTKLQEDYKWSLPCYSFEGANVVIVQPFKACLGLMFFKGSLLKDTKQKLVNNVPTNTSTRDIPELNFFLFECNCIFKLYIIHYRIRW